MHISTEQCRTSMFLGLKRVVSEDYKTTKIHILDICRKFNIFDSITKIGFIADGALWNCVANKLPSIKNDIEIPMSGRCNSHNVDKITKEWYQKFLILRVVGQRLFHNSVLKTIISISTKLAYLKLINASRTRKFN